MAKLWSERFTSDPSLGEAMASNRRVPVESSHSFQFVNQSNLLPEELKNDHVYTSPTYGSSELAQKYPGFLDPRVAPLLASDAQPRGLPLAYVLTCERNVLRDDGATHWDTADKAVLVWLKRWGKLIRRSVGDKDQHDKQEGWSFPAD